MEKTKIHIYLEGYGPHSEVSLIEWLVIAEEVRGSKALAQLRARYR